MTVPNWAGREKIVIELYKKGVSPKNIAHQQKMSLRDVYKIINKNFAQNKKELTAEHQAVILFLRGKRPVDVAIKLRISLDDASQYFTKYEESFYLGQFGRDYWHIKGYIKELSVICDVMKNAGMNVKDLVDEYNLSRDLAEMEERLLTVVRDTEFYECRKNIVLSELKQAQNKLTSTNSNIVVANAELARINQSFNNTNQHNNANYANYGYSNSNPYYKAGYNYGNVRYW